MPEGPVVVAKWSAERHFAATVRCLFDQTFCYLELIMVDGGATERTAEMVAGFQDLRVRLVRQSNSGQSAASNRGASLARGRFLKFVDGDDLSCPDQIRLQHQEI